MRSFSCEDKLVAPQCDGRFVRDRVVEAQKEDENSRQGAEERLGSNDLMIQEGRVIISYNTVSGKRKCITVCVGAVQNN